MECPVELVDAEVEEDNGYFFQKVGELRFTKEGSAKQEHSHCIAVAARHGVTAFADGTGKPVSLIDALKVGLQITMTSAARRRAGVHVVFTEALVRSAVKGEEGRCVVLVDSGAQLGNDESSPKKPGMRRELAPVDAVALGAHTLPVQSSWLALSSDEQLLAVCEGSNIHVHPLHALVNGSSMEPLATWRLPSGATPKQVRKLAVLGCGISMSCISPLCLAIPAVCMAAGVAARRAAGRAGSHRCRAAPEGQPGRPA